MGPRSSRVIEIIRETIQQAELTSELGPDDPGVIELKRLLVRWLADWHEGARVNEQIQKASRPTIPLADANTCE
jgi:hypothetical protein